MFAQMGREWWQKKTRGFVAPVKAIAPECTDSRNISHRDALAVENDPVSLNMLLGEAVKIYVVV
jgi:hypothetical protein